MDTYKGDASCGLRLTEGREKISVPVPTVLDLRELPSFQSARLMQNVSWTWHRGSLKYSLQFEGLGCD